MKVVTVGSVLNGLETMMRDGASREQLAQFFSANERALAPFDEWLCQALETGMAVKDSRGRLHRNVVEVSPFLLPQRGGHLYPDKDLGLADTSVGATCLFNCGSGVETCCISEHSYIAGHSPLLDDSIDPYGRCPNNPVTVKREKLEKTELEKTG